MSCCIINPNECTECQGTGKIYNGGIIIRNGINYSNTSKCRNCDGKGFFNEVEITPTESGIDLVIKKARKILKLTPMINIKANDK